MRAQLATAPGTPQRWGSVDIMQLERESLLRWLRSRLDMAIRTLLVLFRHRVDE